MPDFLHEGKEAKTASSPPADSTMRAPTHAPSGPPSDVASEHHPSLSGRAQTAPPMKRKMPPAIFTHYYGIFFLLLVAAFLGGAYMLLVPRYMDMKSVANNTMSVVATLEEEQSYLDALNRSIQAAEAIPAEALVKVDEAIPRSKTGIPKLLVTMSAIAEASGVQLGNVEFSEGEAAAGMKSKRIGLAPIQITTAVQADGYQEMRRFLSNLEKSLRLIDVNSINVTAATARDDASDAASERIVFTYSLQLTAYTLASVAQAASTPLQGASPSIPLTVASE